MPPPSPDPPLLFFDAVLPLIVPPFKVSVPFCTWMPPPCLILLPPVIVPVPAALVALLSFMVSVAPSLTRMTMPFSAAALIFRLIVKPARSSVTFLFAGTTRAVSSLSAVTVFANVISPPAAMSACSCFQGVRAMEVGSIIACFATAPSESVTV